MTHIQQRRDEAAIWTSVNPVMFDGEAGHESDTGKWKIGDGVTAWNDLPYKAGVDSVDGETGVLTGFAKLASPVFTGNPTAPTPVDGDDDTSIATTAFVKSVLAEALADLTLVTNPVGSIYMSVTDTNPGTFMGGTWVAWGSGRVPVGVDAGQAEFDTVEETGGAKTHTLTTLEMPAHGHSQQPHTHTQTAHDHATAPHGHAVTNSNGGGAALTGSDNPIGTAGASFFTVGEPIGNVTISDTTVDVSPIAAINNDATATNNDSGGGEAHNNLQPYITCFMFKRTA